VKSVRTLIDLARAKVHTDRELAKRLTVHHVALAEMKSGKRAISPETAAALCDILQLPGDEAREWIALAIIENPKNASRAELLKRALFACWALGVVAAPSTIMMNDAEAKSAPTATSITEAVTPLERTVYTLSRIWDALRRGAKSRLFRGRTSSGALRRPRFAA
jgi:transcriptional regulator with XRE-family HTH domain